jgi:heme/copper-type cytochrome/quinol oxidase subunit 4
MNQVMKRYTRAVLAAILAYVIAVPLVIYGLEQMGDSVWRYGVAILPVVPVALGVRAFLHMLEGIDELQRRIQLSGIAFAAASTGLITFAYGWLEVAGLPSLPLLWVFPLMIALWGVGLALANKKYR